MRTFFFVFLIVLVCSSRAQDLAAIEQLHQQDVAAAKAGDAGTLATLWTDDAVALPPGERPVIGIDAIREWLKKGQENGEKLEITEYKIDFQEVHVFGDEAVEWGRTRVAMRLKAARVLLVCQATFCASCEGNPMARGRSQGPYGTSTRPRRSQPSIGSRSPHKRIPAEDRSLPRLGPAIL